MTSLKQCWAFLCWVAVMAGGSLAAQQTPQVKCEHAAPPFGMHYVCDNPQKPCYCRLEPDNPDAPPGDYDRKEAAPTRRVWADVRRKTFYCYDKKPAKLTKHYRHITEEEARRRGYKPAAADQCK